MLNQELVISPFMGPSKDFHLLYSRDGKAKCLQGPSSLTEMTEVD